MSEILISADNISLITQGRKIIDCVSLDIKEDSFISVIGPNGAGKTMLLRCLMKLVKLNSGKVSHKKGLKIGYVPQSLHINNAIPINVRSFLRLNKKDSLAKITEISHETNIEMLMNYQISSLSGGELQRVLLARSLLSCPDILILDEPVQNLDISNQITFYKILDEITKQRKIAVLMISHDLHVVMASTQQVICFNHHICCQGQPQEIAQNTEFKHLFGAHMAKFLAVYHHHHEQGHDELHNHPH